MSTIVSVAFSASLGDLNGLASSLTLICGLGFGYPKVLLFLAAFTIIRLLDYVVLNFGRPRQVNDGKALLVATGIVAF
jgi:hypothetical protein